MDLEQLIVAKMAISSFKVIRDHKFTIFNSHPLPAILHCGP